jgi:hypothetical protein
MRSDWTGVGDSGTGLGVTTGAGALAFFVLRLRFLLPGFGPGLRFDGASAEGSAFTAAGICVGHGPSTTLSGVKS